MSNDLKARLEECQVGIASRGQKQPDDTFLSPRLRERLRQRLQGLYRRATGETHAVLSVDAPAPIDRVVGGDKPITHLVWLQGRRGPDDVEDYYEVARPGDKCVDGSDPFPVYVSPEAVTKERDYFYNQWRSCWAPLTPRSEEEKRGFERVLAILKTKLSDGGGIVGPSDVQRAHNDFYRGRRVAFEECATMLRAAIASTEGAANAD